MLRLVVRGQHLHLGHGVEVLRAHHEAAGGPYANRRCAVDGGHELVGAAAVDRGDASRERAGLRRHRAAHVVADDARRELRHLRGAAAAEWRFGDLLGADGPADHGGVDECRRRFHLHDLAQGPDLQGDVLTRMFTPALTVTPDLVIGLKPESDAVRRYSPTGTLGKV